MTRREKKEKAVFEVFKHAINHWNDLRIIQEFPDELEWAMILTKHLNFDMHIEAEYKQTSFGRILCNIFAGVNIKDIFS